MQLVVKPHSFRDPGLPFNHGEVALSEYLRL